MNRQFALIGHPLGHSLSPQLHRRLFELAGRPGSYALLDLDPAQLSGSGLRSRLEELDGFNVTIPYKTDIIPLLDELDADAAFYGAVNTVANRGGRLTGHNTDVAGFCLALRQAGVEEALTRQVCVIGVGGAGRTMALEAGRRGGRVTLAVRPSSLERAETLAKTMAGLGMAAEVCPVEALRGGWDLLVNASPAGMFPHTEAMAAPLAALEGTSAVFDAVYNPGQTLLLRKAEEQGCRCVGGMAMLVWQGAEAHRIWDGDAYAPGDMTLLTHQLYGELSPSGKNNKEETHP